MNIIRKLSLRTIKKNKSSTMVTLVGIVMSVALMTGLFLFANGLLAFTQQAAIEKWGDSHILFQQAPKSVAALAAKDAQLTDVGRIAHLGAQKTTGQSYNYYNVLGIDPKDSAAFPLKISQGRMPENAGEALVNNAYNRFADPAIKVGDQLEIVTYDLWDGHYRRFMMDDDQLKYVPTGKSYSVTIVGILDNNPLEVFGGRPAYYLYMPQSEIIQADYQLLAAKLPQVDSTLIGQVEERYSRMAETRVMANSNVVELYPGVPSTFRTLVYGFVAALTVIVAVAGIGLIYNSFLISISRRARELSLLSSVGMTRKQKWQMVIYEGLFLYLLALPIGLLSGVVAMRILFRVLNPMLQNVMRTTVELKLVWDGKIILLIAAISLFTIVAAALLPVWKSSIHSPLSGIRRNHEIREIGKPIATPKWIRRMFGFSGDFAWKNVKRNKSRFNVNLAPLILSLVLYLTMASIFSYADIGSTMASSAMQEDIQVSFTGLPAERDTFEQIAKLDQVAEAHIVYNSFAQVQQEDLILEPAYLEHLQQMQYDLSGNKMLVDLIAFGKEDEQWLLGELGLAEDILENQGALLIGSVQHQNPEIVRLKALKGSSPRLTLTMDGEPNIEPVEIRIQSLLDEPLKMYDTWSPHLRVIVNYDTMQKFARGSELVASSAFLIADEKKDVLLYDQVNAFFREHPQQSLNIFDNASKNQSDRDMLMISSILFFGFITIIALISIANIYNALSASLRSRRQEFAMLQSVGMERATFRKIVLLEGLYTALKVLIFGVPLGILASYGMYRLVSSGMGFEFSVPIGHFALAGLAVVTLIMLIITSGSRYFGQENIIEQIRSEYE